MSGLEKELIENYILRLLVLPIDEFSTKLISVFLEYDIRNDKNAIYDLSKEERALLEHIRKTSQSYHFPPEMLDLRSEPNSNKKERLYKQLIKKFPSDPYVLNDYANFLSRKEDEKRGRKILPEGNRIKPLKKQNLQMIMVYSCHIIRKE